MRKSSIVVLLALVVAGITIAAFVTDGREAHYEKWQPSSISGGRVIKLDSSAPGFWWVRLRLKMGDLNSGARGAEQVVAWYPSSASAHYNLGAFLYLFQSVRAKQEFERAHQLDPNYALATAGLAQLTRDMETGFVPRAK